VIDAVVEHVCVYACARGCSLDICSVLTVAPIRSGGSVQSNGRLDAQSAIVASVRTMALCQTAHNANSTRAPHSKMPLANWLDKSAPNEIKIFSLEC
jgi:hypothetical protein